ncbi:Spy/CpxP family protein refolding chaperone [Limnobacter sp.]|uniref:Spy/CpxP family protein refolding chaperone n=1 Tax=Limnobacter sp. TaxID=2003368 RepID=UPI002FE19929
MNVSKLTIQKMITVTAMAMAIPMSAYAGHHEAGDKKQHSEMRHQHKHGGMGMLKQLDLTEAQQAQVNQIMQKQRTEMKSAMSDRRAHREEMKSLVENDTFDAARAERLIAQQQDKERAMKLGMLRAQHEVYKVLTPEQREKAKVIRAQWKEKMKDRHHEKSGNTTNAL